ncbi:MAG: hypothetical protein ACJAVK_002628 [Akkermansiaceae bacterium]|jgi:hypothetical protein
MPAFEDLSLATPKATCRTIGRGALIRAKYDEGISPQLEFRKLCDDLGEDSVVPQGGGRERTGCPSSAR